jgi:hypothetical protein
MNSRLVEETVWHNPTDQDFYVEAWGGSKPAADEARNMSGLGAGVSVSNPTPDRIVVPAGGEAVLPRSFDAALSRTCLVRVGTVRTKASLPKIGIPGLS